MADAGKKGGPYLADDVGELTVANKQELLKILDDVQYKTVRPNPADVLQTWQNTLLLWKRCNWCCPKPPLSPPRH